MHSGLFFDLDDTLYPQRDDVAQRIEATCKTLGLGAEASAKWLDKWLIEGNTNRKLIDELVASGVLPIKKKRVLETYRQVQPVLALPADILVGLQKAALHAHLFLVTNGNQEIQESKIRSLELRNLFEWMCIPAPADRKPSPHCIEFLLRKYRLSATACVFFGNDRETDGGAAAASGIVFCHADYKELGGRLANLEIA